MADPRFFDNKGPFALGDLCARVGVPVPDGVAPDRWIADVASLKGAGPDHISFVQKWSVEAGQSKAGFAFVPVSAPPETAPAGMVRIPTATPSAIFAKAISLFYPDASLERWDQTANIHPTARLEAGVQLAPGVIVGPNAEIGANTQIGPHAVIGRGVTIGRDCVIGAHVALSYCQIGDSVTIHPHTSIGQPGFGFTSSPDGHARIPQIGRAIVQDRVQIGAGCTIDRAALGDTVVGEGTKIDNLVHIGHNNKIGRHCIIVGQAGLAGSCELEDFVVVGGQVGLADHCHVGQGARFAGQTGAVSGTYPGGQDYGGTPARTLQEWKRESATLAILARKKKRSGNG